MSSERESKRKNLSKRRILTAIAGVVVICPLVLGDFERRAGAQDSVGTPPEAGHERGAPIDRSTLGQALPNRETEVVIDLSGLEKERFSDLAEALPAWEEPLNAGTQEIQVSESEALRLQEAGFEIEIIDQVDPESPLPAWPACYSRVLEVHDWLRQYEAEHPRFVEIIDIGDSYCKEQGGCTTPGGETIEGADILVAKITNELSPGPKPGRFWIDGGLHSRELPTIELMKTAIEHFVSGYGVDAEITHLLDHRELYVGIASNPDGRLHVEMGANETYNFAPWLWRKNARDDSGGTCAWPPSSGNQYGVDLNRNQAFKFDVQGHSKNPCAATYRGESPASEPEIQAYEDFLRSIFDDQRGPEDTDMAGMDTTGIMVNFHNATYPGTVLVPWGWTEERSANEEGLSAIANRYSLHNGYRVQHSLYPVSGNTRDWSYGELGIPSYVIELQGRTFVTPCSELPGIMRQNLPAIEMMLGIADRPYERIRGPEVAWIRSPESVDAESGGRIQARLSELRSGGDTIQAAEIFLVNRDASLAPPSLEPGSGLSMIPSDGSFDERSEVVELDLDAVEWQAGQYLILIRAQDSNGYWGDTQAEFIEFVVPAVKFLSPPKEDLGAWPWHHAARNGSFVSMENALMPQSKTTTSD